MTQPPLDRFDENRNRFLDATDADLGRREDAKADRADRQREDDYERQCQEKDDNE